MISVVDVAYNAGYLFLFLTVAGSAYALWRHRDPNRLDILALVVSVLAGPFVARPGNVFWVVRTSLLFLVQPYASLRLVRYFRDLPRWLVPVVVSGAVLAIVVLAMQPHVRPGVLSSAAFVYSAAVEVYAGVAFASEFQHTAGVSAQRLIFAAIGTFCLAARNMLGAIALALDNTFPVYALLTFGIGISYFLAFAPPRFLRGRWQRAEQARYLSKIADRGPEDRGRLAVDDLNRAAERSVAHSLILVAASTAPDTTPLVTTASTNPDLLGLELQPRAGLVGRVLADRLEQSGRPEDCEPELASRVRGLGAEVLVAPIASTTHIWGVVVVVQRRGSLFPEDDLRLLAQLGRYAATALDHARLVTEARERERRAADRRLREIESRMSLMLDSIKDYAMFVLDQHGRVATWQVGAEHVFGYTGDEMTDEPAETLFDMTPEEFAGLLADARRVGHAEHEGTCRRRDAARFMGITTIRPLESEPGDPPGFVAVTHDVTERRNLQARLQQSQKMEAIGQLAGGIAHDFNNQLTAILGYAQWLQRELNGQPERKEEVGEIQRAAERAASLTRQLLSFSRKQMSRPSAVHLSGLVNDLMPMLRRVIGEHVKVVAEAPDNAGSVLGDRTQLEQVVLNLAVNARDAMPRGGQVTIRVAPVLVGAAFAPGELAPGRHVLLEVHDTGTGMDRTTLSHIFEPFFTTKEFGGTGLGLATVYGIVKQMAGAIRVESEVGQGTTFRLYFPETLEREAPKPEEPVAEILEGHETILIVEDDDVVRTFMKRALERSGYRVLVAEHPEAGLAVAKMCPDRIDLAITDIGLPGMSGLEFVRELASIQSSVPALYISGYADAVLAREGTRPKASHFLQKPFSAADLLKRVRQVLTAG
jgi:PAS domain S-box-containing protein